MHDWILACWNGESVDNGFCEDGCPPCHCKMFNMIYAIAPRNENSNVTYPWNIFQTLHQLLMNVYEGNPFMFGFWVGCTTLLELS